MPKRLGRISMDLSAVNMLSHLQLRAPQAQLVPVWVAWLAWLAPISRTCSLEIGTWDMGLVIPG